MRNKKNISPLQMRYNLAPRGGSVFYPPQWCRLLSKALYVRKFHTYKLIKSLTFEIGEIDANFKIEKLNVK